MCSVQKHQAMHQPCLATSMTRAQPSHLAGTGDFDSPLISAPALGEVLALPVLVYKGEAVECPDDPPITGVHDPLWCIALSCTHASSMHQSVMQCNAECASAMRNASAQMTGALSI